MLRVIGGELKRRKLRSPPDGATTRPMPDMVRQAIFNLLRGHTEGQPVMDVFSGTGPMGIEALSRGASRCVFVEKDKRTAEALELNLRDLSLLEHADIVRGDALGPSVIARCPSPVHLVFFDPPYPMVRDAKQWPRVVTQLSRLGSKLTPDGYLMLRTPWPFYHETVPEGGSTPETLTVDLADEAAEDELDAFERELAAAAGVPTERSDIDLHIPGLIGPETHPYRHTAVHLYMRAPTTNNDPITDSDPIRGDEPGSDA